jgi:hypothetical protein
MSDFPGVRVIKVMDRAVCHSSSSLKQISGYTSVMAAPKGHPPYGGRTAGTPNNVTTIRREALEQAYADAGLTPERIAEVTPLQAMLICMHWALEAKNPAAMLAAASAAAPYVHPRESRAATCGLPAS